MNSIVLDRSPLGAAPAAATMPPLRGLGLAVVAYLLLVAVLTGGLLFWLGGLAGAGDAAWAALWCLAPAVLAARLTATDSSDRQQYLARLAACGGMLPLLLLMWAGTEPMREPPVLVALAFLLAGAMHLVVFVAGVVAFASRSTRIAPAASVAPIGAARLGARLMSLPSTGLHVRVCASPGGRRWLLDFPAAQGRRHQASLTLEGTQPVVQVRERVGAAGVAPANADEASLRGAGDDAFDPTRPNARRVWSATAQASIIQPQRLAAVPLRLLGDAVKLPAGHAAALDGDGIVATLAALVAASGYVWQPGLGRL